MPRKRDPLKKVDRLSARAAKYPPVAAALTDVYGELTWTRHQDPMDELISCILSQNTNDTNRDRAFARLKSRFPTWEATRYAPLDDLTDALRPAGLAAQKAPRIQEALAVIFEKAGEYSIDFLEDMPLGEAKAWLISLNGVGPKTAAIVLCFAFGRPAFPVDTHIFRVSKRIGFLPAALSADDAHDVMEAIVPPERYFQFHIHLIQHGRDTCHARKPACEKCPLSDCCDFLAAASAL